MKLHDHIHTPLEAFLLAVIVTLVFVGSAWLYGLYLKRKGH